MLDTVKLDVTVPARQFDYFKNGLSNTLLAIEQSQRCRRSL